MKKRTLKALSLTLVAVMLLVSLPLVSASAVVDYDIAIKNPYESVDWDTYNNYKANLHTHTIISDGSTNIDEMVEHHYSLGYDLFSITDHGVVSAPWDQLPAMMPIAKLIKMDRKKGKTPTALTTERFNQIQAGTDRGGRGMTYVPLAIEQNAGVPSNNHVNTYFADYGQGKLGVDGDYETPIKAVHELGGISIINHPGEFTGGRHDASKSKDPKYVHKFADIFMRYDSCLGFDINSKGDGRTRHDRILWDETLKLLAPHGRIIWGFASSDAHSIDATDKNWIELMMPTNNIENFRTAMVKGTFFAVGRYAVAELGEEFALISHGPTPKVTKVIVDDAADTITIEGINFNDVKWVSDGEVIHSGATINLDEHVEKLGAYVRAYATGDGGIVYVQPFGISGHKTITPQEIKPPAFDYSKILRQISDVISKLIGNNSVVIAIRKLIVGV